MAGATATSALPAASSQAAPELHQNPSAAPGQTNTELLQHCFHTQLTTSTPPPQLSRFPTRPRRLALLAAGRQERPRCPLTSCSMQAAASRATTRPGFISTSSRYSEPNATCRAGRGRAAQRSAPSWQEPRGAGRTLRGSAAGSTHPLCQCSGRGSPARWCPCRIPSRNR